MANGYSGLYYFMMMQLLYLISILLTAPYRVLKLILILSASVPDLRIRMEN